MPFSNSADPKITTKRRIAWFALFAASMAGLVVMAISGVNQRNYVKCNAEQVAILIENQREFRIAAEEERQAHDVVRRAQRDGDEDAERVAIERYFEIRKAADARRDAHPLPDLPQNVCGREPQP